MEPWRKPLYTTNPPGKRAVLSRLLYGQGAYVKVKGNVGDELYVQRHFGMTVEKQRQVLLRALLDGKSVEEAYKEIATSTSRTCI